MQSLSTITILRESIASGLLRKALKLALPIAAGYLVVVAGLLVELYFVSNAHLGADAIGALGLASTLSLVLVLSFHAIEIATQAIAARRYGEGDPLAAGKTLDNALLVSFGLGIPLTLILYLLGDRVFASSKDPNVTRLALEYFRWRLPSVPLMIGSLAVIGFFNAVGKPAIPMAVFAVILTANGLLDAVLIKGAFGIPAMGMRGAGLAQTISAGAGFLVFLAILLLPKHRQKYRPLHFLAHVDRAVMGPLMKLSGPVFVQQFLGNFGMYVFLLINSYVPDDGVSLSASTLARYIGYITYLPSLGFGIAAATMVGQALGAKDARRAYAGGFLCWLLGAIFMVSMGAVYIIFRNPLVSIFIQHVASTEGAATGAASHPELLREVASSLLVLVGAYQIFESVNTIIGKALQGAGATLFVMIVSVAMQWGVFIPLAYFLAIVMNLGAFGAVLALAIQLAIIALIFIFKYRAGGWMKVKL
ncbi:MATE family efflux transporter [soil metagenome]